MLTRWACGVAVVGALVGIGCGGHGSTSPTAPSSTSTPPAPVTVTSITATAVQSTLFVGETTTFTGTAYKSDGTSEPLVTTTCEPETGPIVAVTEDCTVTALAPGTYSKAFSFEGSSSTAVITVVAVQIVTSITVTAVKSTLIVGETTTLTGTAHHEDGATRAVEVSCTPGSDSVVSVTAECTVTALEAGTTTISATYEGHTGSVAITVVAPTVTSITVTAGKTTLTVDETTTLTGTAHYSNGTSAAVNVSCTPGSGSVVSVTAECTVTAVGAGTTSVSATYEGQTGSVTLTVQAKTVTGITLNAGDAALVVGQTTTLTLTHHYADGTSKLVDLSCNFGGIDVIVSISADCILTALEPGTTTLTVTRVGHTDSLVITVGYAAANLQFVKAAGGPTVAAEPYWLKLVCPNCYSWSSDYEDYEGHGKNEGLGCAKNVAWTVTWFDANGVQVETDTDSMPTSSIIGAGATFEFNSSQPSSYYDPGLAELQDRVKNGYMDEDDATYEVTFTWTDTLCPS